MLTVQEVERSLPSHLKTNVTQSFVDTINNITNDPIIAETIRNNFISYGSVMREGKFKLEDYLNAVAYVSYKVMGYSNRDAYARTFPSRYAKLIANSVTDKDISSYVAAYNKNKLVNLVWEQSMIPFWLLNRDIRQKAVANLVDLMENANSEKVRSDSAAHLLNHLKEPETKKVELNLGTVDNSGLDALKNSLGKLVELQQQAIENGVTTKQIAHQTIIDAEVISNDSD